MPTHTISFDKGETDEQKFSTRTYMGHLHVNIGPLTIIFYDAQEGLDVLNALATVPPVELDDYAVPVPVSTGEDDPTFDADEAYYKEDDAYADGDNF